MKRPDLLHVDKGSWKLKVVEKYWSRRGQKCVRPLWSKNIKISCISRRKESKE